MPERGTVPFFSQGTEKSGQSPTFCFHTLSLAPLGRPDKTTIGILAFLVVGELPNLAFHSLIISPPARVTRLARMRRFIPSSNSRTEPSANTKFEPAE